MPITIGSNIFSIRAQRYLTSATRDVGTHTERLASGLRINRAADDAAGLMIADSLRAEARIATRALLNANIGVSMLQVADSAFNEISGVLTRMAELAEQAATGTYSNTQRSALEREFAALGSEIERISRATTFNSIALLSGTETTALQVGLRGDSFSQLFIRFGGGQLQDFQLASANRSELNYTLTGATESIAQGNARTALDAVNNALNLLGARRGELGGNQSRLESAISNLETSREQFKAAESRIRDADTAVEVAALVQAQIRQQTASLILRQVNLQPQLALELLKDV